MAVFKTSDIYLNNRVYFDNLAKCFNQEIADIFYSYLISINFNIDLRDIPKTEIRQEAIAGSIKTPMIFIKDMFENGAIPLSSYYIKSSKTYNAFITLNDMYEIYKDWYKNNTSSTKCHSKQNLPPQFENYKNIKYVKLHFFEKKKINIFHIKPECYTTTNIIDNTNPLQEQQITLQEYINKPKK